MVYDRIVAMNDMDKINLRIISLVMILVISGSLCFGLMRCRTSVLRPAIEDLQSRDGLMLVLNGALSDAVSTVSSYFEYSVLATPVTSASDLQVD